MITSDQTPWRNLPAQKAGWDVDLNEKGSLHGALEHALSMDGVEYREWAEGARKLAERFMDQQDFACAYERLFFY